MIHLWRVYQKESDRNTSYSTVKAKNAKEAKAKARRYGWTGKFKVTLLTPTSNPPKDKWIPAKAVKFNPNGSVSLRK